MYVHGYRNLCVFIHIYTSCDYFCALVLEHVSIQVGLKPTSIIYLLSVFCLSVLYISRAALHKPVCEHKCL